MSIPVGTASCHEWALWYASQGHPVFPLHTPTATGCSCRQETCASIGKHPRVTGGLTQATTEATKLTRWWTQWPDANIGLRTGVTFWALDIDPRKGGDSALHAWEQTHGTLPDTPHSLTGGGGEHLAFALPNHGAIHNGVDLAPGIDVRGDGGYIVVPPSLHASGRTYCWDAASDLEDAPLAQAPDWLLALCQDRASAAPMGPEATIPEGKRNETLSRMGYAMRKAGMSLKEIHAGLDAVNVARCHPALDAEELLLIVEGKRDIGPDPILRASSNGTPPVPKSWPELISATAILTANHPPPAWIIPGLLPEGLTIVGGLPKVAKSYLAYDLALACAGQGLGLGHFGVVRGKAAYLAVEDDPGDTQQRLRELRPGIVTVPDLFFLHGEAVPSISEGLVDYLREKVLAYALDLVVIDPLSYVYDPKLGKQTDSFREAKDMLLPLRQLARELHFALVFVDHRRKQGKDDADVFQTLYGSVAKYAVADALIMVIRKDDEVTLHCRGRKIKDQIIACEFTFDQGCAYWKVQGTSDFHGTETLREKILQAFRDAERLSAKRGLKVQDVIEYAELGQTPQMMEMVRNLMFRMFKNGELHKADRGVFLLAGDDDARGIIV